MSSKRCTKVETSEHFVGNFLYFLNYTFSGTPYKIITPDNIILLHTSLMSATNNLDIVTIRTGKSTVDVSNCAGVTIVSDDSTGVTIAQLDMVTISIVTVSVAMYYLSLAPSLRVHEDFQKPKTILHDEYEHF